MLVRDRKKLARLMVIQEVSQRELAEYVGWASHSYLGRILKGTVKSVDSEKALLIAHRLGVPVDDIFLTKVTTNPGRTDKRVAA